MILETVIDQHAEEASFLWLLRDAAVRAPNYDLNDLVKLDRRVDAHLDALLIAGDHAWRTCAEALQRHESGEVFAAAALALESGDDRRVEQVFSVVEAEPETARGMISAFGWASPEHLRGVVKQLLSSTVALRRRVGLAACAVHRVSADHALRSAVAGDDELLAARALRAIGELGRSDLGSLAQEKLRANDSACRFWAAWSAVLTGDRRDALELLRSLGASESRFGEKAMQLALRAMGPGDARSWLRELNDSGSRAREVVLGVGISGDPTYLPWVIKQMGTPEFARVAGEAFATVAGIDLALSDMQGEAPEGFEVGPTEDPEDESVAMDPDRDLPWPNQQLVQAWWETNKSRFVEGRRYLVGKPITAEHCEQVLRTGTQRQRIAAALELALTEPSAPLFETRAPGPRQKALLSS